MRAHAHARTKALFLTILMVLMVQTPMLSSDFSDELPEIIEPSETTGTAIDLEVGGKHSCAYASIRDVKCWGNGSSGQLGIGNSLLIGDEANEMGESLPFSLLGSQFEVHQLALSDTHTCAVNATGAVKCWGEIALLGIGYDDSDGFGDGYIEMGDVLPYLSLPTGRSVDMIEAGGSHTCAVLDNNDLICWGENEAGQLGLGNTTHIGDDADEIGDDFSTVSLPSGRTVDALALGADHTCALLDDASIVCWGDNTYGQLGIGNTNTIGDGAGEMGDSLSTVSLPTGRTATEITAGQDITCAILDNNDLICWGNNDYGQLGQGNTVDVDDPSGLSAISLGSNAQSVDAGVNSVCAVVSNAVKCWGRNTEGQLGLGDTNHRGDGINEMGSNLNSISLASGSISQVEVGDGFACALKSSGAIKCWGSGQEGRLGYGDTAYRGDDSQDMPTDDIDLFLSTTFESEDCARMFVPIHDTFNPEEVDLQAVADLGDLNVLELRSDGCASVVYMDDKSDDQLRFATYENGLWAIEIIPHDADGSIIDIDLTFDGNDVPHIVHIDEDNTLYYSTKSNGRWTTSTSPPSLTQVSGSVAEKAEIVFDGTSLSTYATGSSSSGSSSWDSDMDSNGDTHFVSSDGNDVTYGVYSGSSYSDVNVDSVTSGHSVIAVGLNGSIHMLYNTSSGLTYAVCHASCLTASNWADQVVTSSGTDVFDLVVDADMVPLVVASQGSTTMAYRLIDGTWASDQIFNFGSAHLSAAVHESGRLWVSSHLEFSGAPDDLYVFNKIGYAGTGINIDGDGDGWTGMDEIRCQTDRFDASSVPADFDGDGICDRFDSKNDLPRVGESSVITVGEDHACAILADSSVSCWGKNDVDQLGDSSTTAAKSAWAVSVDLPADFEAIDIDAGQDHTCAVSRDGDVYCWGSNSDGQLGIGTTVSSSLPSMAQLPAGVRALSVSAGSSHTCITTQSGDVYCWGNGADSQTGESLVADSSAVFTESWESTPSSEWVSSGTPVWSVDTSTSSDGSSSYKSNNHGSSSDAKFSITLLTDGGNVSFDYRTITRLNLDFLYFCIDNPSCSHTSYDARWSGTNAWQNYNTSFVAGTHTFTWGYGRSSGSPPAEDTAWVDNISIDTGISRQSGGQSSTPLLLDMPSSVGFIEELATGSRHTCARNTANAVYCWGYNGGTSSMTLGSSITTATNSSSPVQVDLAGTGSHYATSSNLEFGGMSAGDDVTCAFNSELSESMCWGANLLGNTSSSVNGTRVDMGSSGDAHTSISVGTGHGCGIVAEEAYCWGDNTNGQLGLGTGFPTSSISPMGVQEPNGWTAIEIETSEGGAITCGLFENSGTTLVYCWGDGSQGALGNDLSYGSDYGPDAPVKTSSGLANEITPQASSSDLEIAFFRPAQIAAGAYHYCAISVQGLVKCWGYNNYGQLGQGNTSQQGHQSNDMGESLAFTNLGTNLTATQIVAGSDHTCALISDGSVKCWGRNDYGQLGQGNSTHQGQQSQQMGDYLAFTDLDGAAIKLAAGAYHTCALMDNGEVKCWGLNYGSGRLGAGTSSHYVGRSSNQMGANLVAVNFGDDLRATDISAGYVHTCAILENGLSKCWGYQYSNYGTLLTGSSSTVTWGDSSGDMGTNLPYLDLGTDRATIQISASTQYSCAILDDGNVKCWGYGNRGQLGYGSTSSLGDSSSEVGDGLPYALLGGLTVNQIYTSQPSGHYYSYTTSTDYSFSCGLMEDGHLRCWGYNGQGQLGIGNTNQIDSTHELGSNLQVTDIGDFVESAALSTQSMCAIRDDGQVRCWGYNGNGQLGHGDTTQRGDGANEMGDNLPDTNLWLRDDDTDADGTINLWDTDDDNDGYLDGDDDFPIDQCAHLDTDGDGMPNTVASNCLTSLVEDIDDDNDNWWDTNETACQTNPLSSSSVPVDTDGDWLCNFVDTDDDNDGWSDADETMCEPRNAWSSFATGQSGTSYTHVAYNHPTDLIFDDYGLRMAGTGPSSGYPTLWSYTDPAVIGNNPDYTHLGSPWHWSQYSSWRVSGELELYDGYAYTSAADMVYKTEVTPTSFASTSDTQYISSLSQSYHSDMAISSNGTVYATAALDIKWRDQEGNTATIQDPTGAYGSYAQIDVDGNGDLHYIAYSNNLGGLYHWVHDGSSWSASPNYIWGGHQNIMDSRFSEMKIDASGTIHAVFVHNTELVYRYSSNGGASWSTGFTDGRPQSNSYAAVEMVLNSSGAPHFAWLDYSNKTLYHTHQVSGNWVHDVVRTSTQTLSYHSVSLALDANDDPFIHSHETSNTYGTSMIHYRGGFMQDVDANQVPGDADNDGICDVLDQATLDYGDVVQLEVGSTSSVVPMMTGLVPNSVSITPALPSGLTFNTLTGEIFGTPQTSDIDGTTYTISTTSSNDPWSGTIIIQILSESPLFNGYEQLPYQQSTDGFNNQLAFDSTGNMYYASRYYSSVSAQANTQFKTGSSTYLVNQYAVDSNDVFVAKRGVDGTWDWVVSAQLCNGEVREMVSDSQGNTHVLVNFHGLAYSSNCDVEIKGTSIDESFSTVNYADSMVMKLDSSGNLLWVTPSSGSRSTGSPQVISTDMVVDSNGNVTISGRATIASSANNITFAGMDLDLGTSCIGNNRAFVVRLDANGNGAWAQAAHSFGNCAHEYSNVKVVSHPSGSATITGTTNYGLDFDGHQISHSSNYYRYLAHVDASGNWQWAKNITQSSNSMSTNTDNAILETLSDGSMLFATAQFGNYCSSGCTLNMDGTSLDIDNQYYVAAMRLGTDGSQHWTQMLGAWGSHSSSGSMYSTVDGDGMVNILMDTESSPSYWRMFGVSEDGDLAYYTGSYTGSSSGKVSDMGTDYFGQPYFFADMRGTYWGKNTLLNTYSSSGQGTPYSMQLYRMFGSLDHAANHTLIGNNSNVNLPAMGVACNGWGSSSCASYTSWTLYPSPPSGLSFDSNKGRLYGTPNQMTANATYMLNATITSPVTRTISVNITFGIAPEAPTVSWNDNMTQAVTRGNAIVTVTPTITTPQYVTSFVSEPALPAGVNLHPVTGVLSGTPSGNMTTTVFTLKACNSWGLCNEGSEFTLTVLEPLPVISYPDTEYEFPKETPINPMVPTNLGGAVETWEVSPDLPYGLTLGEGGIISGIPVGNTPAANYTIWANNSGGSANVTISIAINGTGMYVFYPYDEQRLAIDHPILTIYPSSLGAVPITWSITPDLPDGLEFGTENGTIWGTPTTLTDLETFTVFTQGFEADANSTTTLTIVILPDLDGDGIPDESDPDSDGDGWYDDYEAECETNASDPNSRPFDSDNDGICDGMDDDDGSMILMVYPSAVLELSLNVTMLDFIPYAAGGDIDTWEISPALPLGLNFDGVSPARSTTDTGIISGMPSELLDPTLYTVWANNSEHSAMYTIMVSVLTDNDLDGLPDIYDEDDDNDGWSDEMEDLCSNDSMDGLSSPQDTDGDELCNAIDDDDDDDGFTDEEEAICISDPEDANDTPSDLDGNGICDALESDTDGDGWADGLENACGTDPMDSSSIPDDNDADESCDVLDDDDDNDGSPDVEDAFPLDSGAHTDTDGDGNPDTILYSPYFGNLVEDMDDDGDGWNDTVEIDCGSEPLNATSVPVDADGNGICDINEESEVEIVPEEPPEQADSGLNEYLSWTACCILLLLLLLLLLVLLRGSDKSVMTLIRKYRDAEPENTTSKPVFVFGVGTRDDPFMLDPVEGLSCGSSVESKELITIDNLDSGSIIRFNDMNNRENDGRFRMDSIEVHDDDGEGNGSIRFRLKFDDNLGYESEGASNYEGIIKCGVSSVYFQWNVQTKESANDRKAREKAEADARKAEETRIREEAKAEALAQAAADVEKEKKLRAEVEEKIRLEAEAKARIEAEAKAKAEAEMKAKKAVADEKEAAERQASKEATAFAQRDAEKRLAEMEEKMAAKMAEMEEKMEGLSKKEAELARVAAKAEFIDFKTLGVAKASDKDDLKKIKGVGPFIEEKLNALGIYTFLQVSRMTPEIEEQVNVAIEFFRGRVRRDKWAQQAKEFHDKKE